MSNRFFKNKLLLRVLAVLLGLAVLLTAGGGLLFVCGWNDTVTYQEDAVIVLGCGVDGTEPSDQLRCRLDTAIGYYRQNPSALIIVTGGQGTDEDDTEAAVMARYLVAGGVPSEQVLLEDQATSTAENFRFSAPILSAALPDYSSVCFITSDFHILRSGILAKKAGLTASEGTLTHLHAPTPADRVIANLFREPIVFLKSLLLD